MPITNILISERNNEITKVFTKIKHKYKQIKEQTNIVIRINIIKTNKCYKINHIDYIKKTVIIIYTILKKLKPPYINTKLEDKENSEKRIYKIDYKRSIRSLLYVLTKSRFRYSIYSKSRNKIY